MAVVPTTNDAIANTAVANKIKFIDFICFIPRNKFINLEEDNYGKFSRHNYTLMPEHERESFS